MRERPERKNMDRTRKIPYLLVKSAAGQARTCYVFVGRSRDGGADSRVHAPPISEFSHKGMQCRRLFTHARHV